MLNLISLLKPKMRKIFLQLTVHVTQLFMVEVESTTLRGNDAAKIKIGEET